MPDQELGADPAQHLEPVLPGVAHHQHERRPSRVNGVASSRAGSSRPGALLRSTVIVPRGGPGRLRLA